MPKDLTHLVAGLDADDPVKLCRDRLMKGQVRDANMDQRYKRAILIKCIKMRLRGVKIKNLNWSPDREGFPRLHMSDR